MYASAVEGSRLLELLEVPGSRGCGLATLVLEIIQEEGFLVLEKMILLDLDLGGAHRAFSPPMLDRLQWPQRGRLLRFSTVTRYVSPFWKR